ncbi:MAG: hypothetical protein GJ676_16175 [Rhodobacteraceae bacterium]|nr:hypothetical protein [Paracoccaceae bacterium]
MKLLSVMGVVAVMVVAGCENPNYREYHDGLYFPTKTKSVDKKTQRETFSVQVSRVAQSVDAARKAAHHEGTKYCIANYGSSKIEWVQDPLDEETPLRVTNDQLNFQGTCKP